MASSLVEYLFVCFFFKWFCLFGECFRRRQMNVEPGVGKWVSYLNRERKLDSIVGSRPAVPPAPKGLYIYGNVGCGMLMDATLCYYCSSI